MPVDRLRMRPWLEQMIESNSVSGLVWINKVLITSAKEDEKTFSIPWKHGARQGWKIEKDACLFKLWAIHTKKYTEGKTDADPRTWKANFRCALRSLPDVTEVKNKSIQKGEAAVRVFKMLHVIKKQKEKRTKTKDAKRHSTRSKVKAKEMDHGDSKSPADEHILQHDDTASLQADTVDSKGTQEATCVSNFEVPECASTVEIGPEGNGFYTNFQISPEHSTEYCDPTEEDMIRIAQELEQCSPWMPRSFNNGFDTTYASSSPGSQWSDSSSDEIELKLCTNLPSEVLTVTEDLFNFKEH